MAEAKRQNGKKGGAEYDRIVSHVLAGSNDMQVVIGPLVHPPLGDMRTNGKDYFVIASSEPERGFRCDQLIMGNGLEKDGNTYRARIIAAFAQFGIGRGLLVHDTDDELYMARLCETLWPGERITKLRESIEAERATPATT